MVSNQDMNKHREAGCTGITPDKKYYEVGRSFIKRTLRRHEWMTTAAGWTPPANLPQRWKTDAAILKYLRENTNIPLPRLQHTFEDDGAFYFSTELVPGVTMRSLSEEQKEVVCKELLEHVATLKSLRSDSPGVPGQTLLCAPNRIHSRFWKYHSCWRPKPGMEEGKESYVFCHNDLGQHNIIVDPETLKINAIIDWEYGEWFEQPYWKREGPGAPVGDEEDDRERCREWLLVHCDEVEMQHLPSLEEKLGKQS
ncbi:Protein kinase-like domain protein [Moelleriella libera RCEF 2490]|uniref:Protein kinase-like domain protein n=1 Tax=Moelleriella libera RCEF 2490 TaxID=1081109 RepID=A0A168D4Z6_9HYPO|nr:Protein kinase-like domain protein [Moelleriella libera RCEF 2490]